MNLPEPIAEFLNVFFDAHPLSEAMAQLVVRDGATPELIGEVEELLGRELFGSALALQSGLWLYVDELDRSHRISQQILDATGSFWHGIMHRREGDFGNSHYWFHRVGDHPAMAGLAEYDPHGFIDEVEARYHESPQELVAKQRREWESLFCWCATLS